MKSSSKANRVLQFGEQSRGIHSRNGNTFPRGEQSRGIHSRDSHLESRGEWIAAFHSRNGIRSYAVSNPAGFTHGQPFLEHIAKSEPALEEDFAGVE